MRPSAADALLRRALADAAPLVSTSGYQSLKREERLRRALTDALTRANWCAELHYQPEMPQWPWRGPSRLGEFDVAVSAAEIRAPAIVCELKWCTRDGVDALDEVMWDVLKLAHAQHILPNVRAAYLVYAAPAKAWGTPTSRFRELFAGCDIETRAWLAEYLHIWRWCVRTSSKSRPLAAPRRIRTRRVGGAYVPSGPVEMQVQIAAVEGLWDEPIALDDNAEPIGTL
jgi:hypothetical protein